MEKKIFYLTYKQVSDAINACKELGFEVRLIGGVSWNRDINANIVLIDYDEFGNVYFWVIFYNPKIWRNLEFEDKTESVEALAIRKLKYEIGFNVKTKDIIRAGSIEVDNKIKGEDKKHIKHYLFTDKFEIGPFAYFEKIINSDSKTGPPLCVPIQLLAKELYFGHIQGFKMIVESLLRKCPKYLSKSDLDCTLSILNKRIAEQK